jgi:hypothetical protein
MLLFTGKAGEHDIVTIGEEEIPSQPHHMINRAFPGFTETQRCLKPRVWANTQSRGDSVSTGIALTVFI